MAQDTRKALLIVANKTGATLLPDNAQWTNRLEIRSASSSRLYVVAQNKSNGTWGCGCMGWKSHRRCKHLDTIRPQLIAAGVTVKDVR